LSPSSCRTVPASIREAVRCSSYFTLLVRFFAFICSLFNDAFSDSDYMTLDYWMEMNDEVKKMWKKVINDICLD
jgi:hypothetical protein